MTIFNFVLGSRPFSNYVMFCLEFVGQGSSILCVMSNVLHIILNKRMALQKGKWVTKVNTKVIVS